MSDHGSGEFRFHSSREERIGAKEPAGSQPVGLFRRNRSLLIILLDVLLVLLMFTIYLLFLQPDGSIVVDGYTVEGEAFSFGDEVYVTVTIRARDGAAAVPGSESLVEVEFPDDTTVTDALPASQDHPTVVRHVLAGARASVRSDDTLAVGLTLGGRSSTLEVKVSR